MPHAQESPKRGRPINRNSLHHKMRQMPVSKTVSIFIPAEMASQSSVAATGCVIGKNSAGSPLYTTEQGFVGGVPGTRVWRIA